MRTGILKHVSPFATDTPTADKANTIVSISPIAHEKLLELRDAETEGAQLGLRLEILSQPGEDFRYDLSFDFSPRLHSATKCAPSTGLRSSSRQKTLRASKAQPSIT